MRCKGCDLDTSATHGVNDCRSALRREVRRLQAERSALNMTIDEDQRMIASLAKKVKDLEGELDSAWGLPESPKPTGWTNTPGGGGGGSLPLPTFRHGEKIHIATKSDKVKFYGSSEIARVSHEDPVNILAPGPIRYLRGPDDL